MVGRMTALAVRNAKPAIGPDGRPRTRRYGDGGNLWLQVGPTGGKSWIFRYVVRGKQRLMGLGDLDVVTLAEARDAAISCRRLLHQGIDPLDRRKGEKAERAKVALAARVATFKEMAETYIAAQEAGWRHPKHRQQWVNSLATYAYPVLGKLAVSAIDTDAIMRAVEPIWLTKPETAGRVRGRIEVILDYTASRGLRSGDNPARWNGHLAHMLPKRGKVARVKHHPALPWTDVGAFMVDLRRQIGSAARALEFTILTAARTTEATGATWKEIDLQGAIWTIIPPERMKAGEEHRVPLSEPALAVLRDLLLMRATDASFVFPGGKIGAGLSGAAMSALLKRMDRTAATVHGFRSTFRDWTGEATNFPREIAEEALAHKMRDKTEAAYRRGDALEKRRRLMAEWATYCARPAVPTIPAEVISISTHRATA